MARKPNIFPRDELAAQIYFNSLSILKDLGMGLPGADYRKYPYSIPEHLLPRPSRSTTSNTLCEACLGINVKALYHKDGYRHSSSLAGLLKSSRKCTVCDMIVKEMYTSLRGGWSETVDRPVADVSLVELLREYEKVISTGVLCLLPDLPIYLFMRNDHCDDHNDPQPTYISVATSKDRWMSIGTTYQHKTTGMTFNTSCFGYLVLHSDNEDSQRPLHARGGPHKLLARLRAWLTEAVAKDNQNEDGLTEPVLPTRALDLGETRNHTEDSLKSDLRLVESHGRRGHYVALSYCWGGYEECRTLPDNYEQRLANIAFKDLPPVFAQAVFLTRALGIRYLWIDALCIVQTDQKDWHNEAARLSDVYWNTICRFAVTSSKTPQEGFFPPKRFQNSVPVPHIRYPISIDGVSQPQSPDTLYITLPRFYSDDVDKGHLNGRGWVLQERLLAPRTIHFTRNHVYCESESDICGEDWVKRGLSWMSCIDKVSNHSKIDLLPHEHGGLSYEKEEHHIVYHPWLKVPEIFSRCQLKYDTDRLAALAGLITRKKLNEYSGVRNLVGLWERDLHIELAWVASFQHPAEGAFIGLTYLQHIGLPSWTWLAYQGAINFVADRRSKRDPATVHGRPTQAFELLEASTPDSMIALPLTTPAFLKLRTLIRPLHAVSSMPNKYRPLKHDSRERRAKISPFRFSDKTETCPIDLAELTLARKIFDAQGDWVGDASFDSPTERRHELYCIHISVLRDRGGPEREESIDDDDPITAIYSDHILSNALVVKEEPGKDLAYRRVGMAQVNHLWMQGGEQAEIKLV